MLNIASQSYELIIFEFLESTFTVTRDSFISLLQSGRNIITLLRRHGPTEHGPVPAPPHPTDLTPCTTLHNAGRSVAGTHCRRDLTFAGCAWPEAAVAGAAVAGGDASFSLTALVVLPLTRAVVTHDTGVDSEKIHRAFHLHGLKILVLPEC